MKHGVHVLQILRGALTGDDTMVRAYAAFLADKLEDEDEDERQLAESIRRYLKGDFGAMIYPAGVNAPNDG